MQTTVCAAGEGDVVRLARPLEEHDQLIPLVRDELFGEPESENLAHEAGGVGDVLGGEQAVVEAGRGDAHQIHRHRRRVEQRQSIADLLHLRVDLHRVARR